MQNALTVVCTVTTLPTFVMKPVDALHNVREEGGGGEGGGGV